MKWYGFVSLLFCCAVLILCAHKAPPLTKDRISPKLQKVTSLNNRQIMYTFSESLDTLALSKTNFAIWRGNDTLGIEMFYPALSAAEIVVITDVQLDSLYTTSGFVFDSAQNKGNFNYSFLGTSRPDTIVPWVTRYAKGHGKREFSLTFSEPMDTSFVEFTLLPHKNFKPEWEGQRRCRFVPATPTDSLRTDTTYYLFIDKGIQDITGQKLNTFITFITPDTIYEPAILQGTAKTGDSLAGKGLVILERELAIGITQMNNGTFTFEVRDSASYTIHVISEKYYGQGAAWVDSINMIPLHLEEMPIDSILR